MNGIAGAKRLQGPTSILVAGAAVAALFAASCAPKADTADTAAMAKTLTQVDADWSKAAATKNADAIASYYAADAIAYPPNAPAVTGQAAAKAAWASFFVDPTFTISWQTDHADVAKSGDLGFTAGTYEDSFKGADGKPVHEKGKYVCIWAKQADGSWKAIHDIWNTDTK
jgi:ketosteroid isomerase-like protein